MRSHAHISVETSTLGARTLSCALRDALNEVLISHFPGDSEKVSACLAMVTESELRRQSVSAAGSGDEDTLHFGAEMLSDPQALLVSLTIAKSLIDLAGHAGSAVRTLLARSEDAQELVDIKEAWVLALEDEGVERALAREIVGRHYKRLLRLLAAGVPLFEDRSGISDKE